MEVVVAFNHVWSRNAWNNACLPAELRVARQVKSLHKQQTTCTDNIKGQPITSVSQSVSYFTVPPRAQPSTGSQSGSATYYIVQEAYRKCSRIDLT